MLSVALFPLRAVAVVAVLVIVVDAVVLLVLCTVDVILGGLVEALV